NADGPSMTFRTALCCGAALSALAGCGTAPMATTNDAMESAAATPRQYPVRDFFAKPERAYFRLSDDGRTLGYMQPVTVEGQRRMNVFVQRLEGGHTAGEAKVLTHETARDIGGYFFKGNDRVLYVKDFGGDENFH